MKLLLDTTNKIIKIEESVNLGELVDALDKLLPSGEWKTFKLETNTQIIWQDPIVIRDYQSLPYGNYPWPRHPWYDPNPRIMYSAGDSQGGTVTYQLQAGTYCVEL